MTWMPDDVPVAAPVRVSALGWLRVLVKGFFVALPVFGGLAVLLVLRLPEQLMFGVRRPWTSGLVTAVSRLALKVIGLKMTVEGRPMNGHGGLVANHSSWLDIFTLSAADRFYFVSKSEVAGWPLIGWLARATGTVFIRRERRDTRNQLAVFNARLAVGHRLLFFPEGTSTDGQRVLPFKTTLFEPFLAKGHEAGLMMQPVTVIYTPPAGADARFYGWWGEMSFGPHLLKTLAAPRQGSVRVVFHHALAVSDVSGRKELAARLEAAVRSAHPFG